MHADPIWPDGIFNIRSSLIKQWREVKSIKGQTKRDEPVRKLGKTIMSIIGFDLILCMWDSCCEYYPFKGTAHGINSTLFRNPANFILFFSELALLFVSFVGSLLRLGIRESSVKGQVSHQLWYTGE